MTLADYTDFECSFIVSTECIHDFLSITVFMLFNSIIQITFEPYVLFYTKYIFTEEMCV